MDQLPDPLAISPPSHVQQSTAWAARLSSGKSVAKKKHTTIKSTVIPYKRIFHTDIYSSREGKLDLQQTFTTIASEHSTVHQSAPYVSNTEDWCFNSGLPEVPATYPDENLVTIMQDLLHIRPQRRKRTWEEEPLPRWLPEIDCYLAEFLRLEAKQGGDVCDMCRAEEQGSYRCTICADVANVCNNCILEAHAGLPFHRIEHWTGEFYQKITLRSLGQVIQLGHAHSNPCVSPCAATRKLDVIDIDGIHTIDVRFCDCHRAQPHYVQLLHQRWFPASVEIPRTAITFQALRHYQMLSFMSKISAYEYYHSLARLVDNTGTESSPDKLQIFLRVVREWRHIRLLKRSGRGNDPTGVKGTKPGECAVLCPACPQPGINMVDTREGEKAYLDRLFIAVDANFRLKHNNVSSDEQDPGLNAGYAYFVENQAFKNYLQKYSDLLPEETNTCNNHNAIKLAQLRGKGTAVSGVGAVVCARHDMRRPLSVVDLQKGEAYLNMDYAVLSTLQCNTPQQLVISYDIACQWTVNLWNRIAIYGPGMAPPQCPENVIGLVPKFHLPAHIFQCQQNFSFNWTPHVGRTDGKAPERGWTRSNLVASSTKEMTAGSRRDTLDDHWGDHNWRKVTSIGEQLLCKIKEAVPEMVDHRAALEDFSRSISKESSHHVQEWTQLVKDWENGASTMNPYVPAVKPLTLASVRVKLAEKESQKLTASDHTVVMSASELITVGIQLESAQVDVGGDAKALGPHATDIAWGNVLIASNRLRRSIDGWIDSQQVHVPSVHALHQQECQSRGDERVEVWDIKLWMPSQLCAAQKTCERDIMEYEWELRIAQAEEALDVIRRKVILETYVMKHKDKYTHGQRQGTKSSRLLGDEKGSKERSIAAYNRAYLSLCALEQPLEKTAWRNHYRYLEKEDTYPLNEDGTDSGRYDEVMEENDPAPRKKKGKKKAASKTASAGPSNSRSSGIDEDTRRWALGEGHRRLSWIWMASGSLNSQSPEDMVNTLRIEWCKCRARAERWKEECELVREEMDRVSQFFKWEAQRWTLRAEEAIPGTAGGPRAYALRQAALREDMHSHCVQTWLYMDQWIELGQVPPEDDDEMGDQGT
ncbi:hypothetical protein EDD18DRAFT_1465849 [Armillaria luteobubalina]|uniref:CxC2-like cysteine cluster KDZ transposase-associated domain-containing protein n=1 Tax=Armillaria luteobubalina TaxID=153913 RepID=A0AA39PUV9_9AGAR|nr:hypothetical protein EDD18DRAFT_1465849 [Armillaria luteobubalina]